MTALLAEPVAVRLTAEEYDTLPRNSRIELVDGVVRIRMPATGRHQVVAKPAVAVHTYRLGETGQYLETGLFEEGDTIKAAGLPWATVDVSDLTP